MSATAAYSCTALVGLNKAGTLKPDMEGYYTVTVGAVNSFNSSGAFYPLGPAKQLFEESGSLLRRVKKGNCKGEMGHPKPAPGQSIRDFVQRVLSIEETKVCCHFRKIWLEEQGHKDSQGRQVAAIIAEAKPSGPYGPALKESLENRHENVCFSIRSLTNDYIGCEGYLQKDLKTIVTFDCVTEPGIEIADKWHSPALESLLEHRFDFSDLVKVVETEPELCTSLEDAGINWKDLYDAFRAPPTRPLTNWHSPTPRPSSARW